MPTALPPASVTWTRTSAPGGQFGTVSACTVTYTQVVPATDSFEWAQVAILDNHSADGEHCAAYLQATSLAGGRTWALCADVREPLESAGYGALVGAEISVGAHGPDPERKRRGVHVALNPADPVHRDADGGHGVYVSAGAADDRRWNTGIEVRDCAEQCFTAVGGLDDEPRTDRALKMYGRFAIGLDTSEAAFTTGTALRLGNGQAIALEATDTVRLRCRDGMTQLLWGDRVLLQVDGDGNLWLRGEVRKL